MNRRRALSPAALISLAGFGALGLFVVFQLQDSGWQGDLLSDQRPMRREIAVRPLRLSGGLEQADAELSGLAWVGDELVLLPQFPGRHQDSLFAIDRSALRRALRAGDDPDVLQVRRIPLRFRADPDAVGMPPGLRSLAGFDGFEAIAFHGDRVFIVAEAGFEDPDLIDEPVDHDGPTGVGYLLTGRVIGDLDEIEIWLDMRRALPPQTGLPNTGYEGLVIERDRVILLYEANGDVNPSPYALSFDFSLQDRRRVPLSHLQYRLTDATSVDSRGRFWVSNYHYPGSPWQPGACRLTERYGQGESHSRCQIVERLVEMQIGESGLFESERPPLLLELLSTDRPRNWEGLVRFGDEGFLIVTDEYPSSILAYVEAP